MEEKTETGGMEKIMETVCFFSGLGLIASKLTIKPIRRGYRGYIGLRV